MEGEKLTSCDENKNWLATRAARNLTLLPKQNLAKTTKTLTHTHHNEDWSTKKIQNLKQKVEAKEKTALFPDEKVSLPQPPFQPSISTMPTQLLNTNESEALKAMRLMMSMQFMNTMQQFMRWGWRCCCYCNEMFDHWQKFMLLLKLNNNKYFQEKGMFPLLTLCKEKWYRWPVSFLNDCVNCDEA